MYWFFESVERVDCVVWIFSPKGWFPRSPLLSAAQDQKSEETQDWSRAATGLAIKCVTINIKINIDVFSMNLA